MTKKPRICSVRGCKRSVHANGKCSTHNMRAWKGWKINGAIRPMHRLAPGEPEEIRKRYVSPGAPTVNELAEAYSVGRITIWRVLRAARREFRDELQARIDERARDNRNPAHRIDPRPRKRPRRTANTDARLRPETEMARAEATRPAERKEF